MQTSPKKRLLRTNTCTPQVFFCPTPFSSQACLPSHPVHPISVFCPTSPAITKPAKFVGCDLPSGTSLRLWCWCICLHDIDQAMLIGITVAHSRQLSLFKEHVAAHRTWSGVGCKLQGQCVIQEAARWPTMQCLNWHKAFDPLATHFKAVLHSFVQRGIVELWCAGHHHGHTAVFVSIAVAVCAFVAAVAMVLYARPDLPGLPDVQSLRQLFSRRQTNDQEYLELETTEHQEPLVVGSAADRTP